MHSRRRNGSSRAPDFSAVFYLDMGLPVPFAQVAELAVATLREAYRLHHPRQLECEAWGRLMLSAGTVRDPRGEAFGSLPVVLRPGYLSPGRPVSTARNRTV